MTKSFRKELEGQILDIRKTGKIGFEVTDGIVVKLYNPDRMTDLDESEERSMHTKFGYRVWMSNEFEVLSESQVEALKLYWQ